MVGFIPKSNRLLKARVACPLCNQLLQRVVLAIQLHYFNNHRKRITEAEAYRIASPQKRRTYYVEGSGIDKRTLSGGLPTLGRRR